MKIRPQIAALWSTPFDDPVGGATMQLSAELFEQIVRCLCSDERDSTRHGKRKEGRVGVRCSIDVTPRIFDDNGQRTLTVKIRDISP
jgi:hypothetical protein